MTSDDLLLALSIQPTANINTHHLFSVFVLLLGIFFLLVFCVCGYALLLIWFKGPNFFPGPKSGPIFFSFAEKIYVELIATRKKDGFSRSRYKWKNTVEIPATQVWWDGKTPIHLRNPIGWYGSQEHGFSFWILHLFGLSTMRLQFELNAGGIFIDATFRNSEEVRSLQQDKFRERNRNSDFFPELPTWRELFEFRQKRECFANFEKSSIGKKRECR